MYPVYNKFYYKPLPDCIEVQKSPIEGFGLFAIQDISKDFDIGMSHIKVPIIQGYIRTSIGGFLNHSDDANCFLTEEFHPKRTKIVYQQLFRLFQCSKSEIFTTVIIINSLRRGNGPHQLVG